MPYLDEIVREINDSIKDRLTGEKFILSMQGISKQIPRTDTDETQIPLYVSNSGEGTFNAVDDRYTLSVYHKYTGSTYELFESEFGDDDTFKKENSQMSLLVYSDRSRIKMTENNLIGIISNSFPSILKESSIINKPGLSMGDIQINSIESDSQAIWRREFLNIEYPLKPESILFQINYTIATVINTLCYEPCCN